VQGCTLFNQKTFMIVFCMKVKKVRIMIVFWDIHDCVLYESQELCSVWKSRRWNW
jgi:hypothetical protein